MEVTFGHDKRKPDLERILLDLTILKNPQESLTYCDSEQFNAWKKQIKTLLCMRKKSTSTEKQFLLKELVDHIIFNYMLSNSDKIIQVTPNNNPLK